MGVLHRPWDQLKPWSPSCLSGEGTAAVTEDEEGTTSLLLLAELGMEGLPLEFGGGAVGGGAGGGA